MVDYIKLQADFMKQLENDKKRRICGYSITTKGGIYLSIESGYAWEYIPEQKFFLDKSKIYIDASHIMDHIDFSGCDYANLVYEREYRGMTLLCFQDGDTKVHINKKYLKYMKNIALIKYSDDRNPCAVFDKDDYFMGVVMPIKIQEGNNEY